MTMTYPETIAVSSRGVWHDTPSLNIAGVNVITTGSWLKVARIHDEEWLEDPISDPDRYVRELRQQAATLPADIFTFAQRLPDTVPRYPYAVELESVAAIRLSTYQEWWERLPQETRKNARRAAKRGVVVSVDPLDDALVAGIVALNNETPVRQGRRFPHYGKSFQQVKRDQSTFVDRSEFICAHCEGELIGFLKIVYCTSFGTVLQLITKTTSADRRPANALIAKAVERCEQRRLGHFVYGKFRYGRQSTTSLMEFKARHGFEDMLVPRYVVPLTAAGAVGVRLALHRGAAEVVPTFALNAARAVRGAWHDAAASLRSGLKRRCSSTSEQPRL